jgi:SOS-response transcriptional repressor LexA
MYNEIGERIRALRESRRLSQAQLAKQCGWDAPSRLGNYEIGARKVNAEDATLLALALGVTPAFILFGDDSSTVYKQHEYPLLTKDQILRQELGGLSALDNNTKYQSSTKRVGKKSFWFEVSGHSMTSPYGVKPSFPEGMLVLVDPDAPVHTGDYCVCVVYNKTEVAFKKFVIEDGKQWLEPMNTTARYQSIEVDQSSRVLGRVVKAQWDDDFF